MKKLYFLLLLIPLLLLNSHLRSESVILTEVHVNVHHQSIYSDSLIVGAIVMVKGTTVGTVSNERGVAVLVCRGNATLATYALGYNSVEVARDNRTTIDVALTPEL